MATTLPNDDGHAVDQVLPALDIKEKDIAEISAEAVSIGLGEAISSDEPVTTRLELWSWYAYYFGNNSAGPLSYAPLSERPLDRLSLWQA
jgi:hypothetical protein